MKYRKKPIVVDAMRFTHPPTDEFISWFGQPLHMVEAVYKVRSKPPYAVVELEIRTLEDGFDGRAKHIATEGDWIIRGAQNEMWAIKPDIFELTYEIAE